MSSSINEFIGNNTDTDTPQNKDNVTETPKPDTVSKAEFDALKNEMSQINSSVSTIAESTAKMATQTREAAEVVDAPDVELDPDVEKHIQHIVQNAVKKAKDETVEEMSKKEKTSSLDRQAETDFPWLFDPKHPKYKQEYNNMLKAEYSTLFDNKSPDAVYNAATRAQAKIYIMEQNTKEHDMVREAGARGAMLHSGSANVVNAKGKDDLNEVQRYIAEKLGVSEKVYKESHGPSGSDARRNKATGRV